MKSTEFFNPTGALLHVCPEHEFNDYMSRLYRNRKSPLYTSHCRRDGEVYSLDQVWAEVESKICAHDFKVGIYDGTSHVQIIGLNSKYAEMLTNGSDVIQFLHIDIKGKSEPRKQGDGPTEKKVCMTLQLHPSIIQTTRLGSKDLFFSYRVFSGVDGAASRHDPQRAVPLFTVGTGSLAALLLQIKNMKLEGQPSNAFFVRAYSTLKGNSLKVPVRKLIYSATIKQIAENILDYSHTPVGDDAKERLHAVCKEDLFRLHYPLPAQVYAPLKEQIIEGALIPYSVVPLLENIAAGTICSPKKNTKSEDPADTENGEFPKVSPMRINGDVGPPFHNFHATKHTRLFFPSPTPYFEMKHCSAGNPLQSRIICSETGLNTCLRNIAMLLRDAAHEEDQNPRRSTKRVNPRGWAQTLMIGIEVTMRVKEGSEYTIPIKELIHAVCKATPVKRKENVWIATMRLHDRFIPTKIRHEDISVFCKADLREEQAIEEAQERKGEGK